MYSSYTQILLTQRNVYIIIGWCPCICMYIRIHINVLKAESAMVFNSVNAVFLVERRARRKWKRIFIIYERESHITQLIFMSVQAFYSKILYIFGSHNVEKSYKVGKIHQNFFFNVGLRSSIIYLYLYCYENLLTTI